MMPIQCTFCKHSKKGAKCDAFPDGIPQLLYSEGVSHDEPFPGDNGILFEQIERDGWSKQDDEEEEKKDYNHFPMKFVIAVLEDIIYVRGCPGARHIITDRHESYHFPGDVFVGISYEELKEHGSGVLHFNKGWTYKWIEYKGNKKKQIDNLLKVIEEMDKKYFKEHRLKQKIWKER